MNINPQKRTLGDAIKRILQMREFILIALLMMEFIVLWFTSPYFMTADNIIAVIFGCSLDAIIAVGMTLVIVSGEFDMSVGSTLALTGIIVAKLILAGVPVPVCIVLAVLLGLFIGFLNGVIITKLGISSFITTLGTQGVVRGIALVITEGSPVTSLPNEFKIIGQGYVGKIPYIFFIMFVIIVVGEFLLRKSGYFRQIYYIGGNITAAKYSGIKADRVKIVMFMTVSALAALAGVLNTARLGSAYSSAGDGAELRAITAVIIGGAALTGGEGTVLGTFIGVIILAFTVNALVLLNVSIYWQGVVSGLVLLGVVAVDRFAKMRRLKA